MQLLTTYLLKLAFCLALGYLFYFLLLRRMTYYTWNRYFLLIFPLVAIVIPVLPKVLPQKMQNFNINYIITDVLPSVTGADNTIVRQGVQWNPINIAITIILAGMLFFFCRFAIRLYSIYRTRSAARLMNHGEIKLYHLAGCTAPFSFYNSIYLDTANYDQTELEKIIEHELVHVTQKHTLDMLLSEWLCIVQWFNPFVWLMKHAIKQNLEFIADDAVLQKGINRKGYQYLLLKVSGGLPYTLANNLLFPSLKKRIHMMNRTKTRKVHLLKFMCIVPLGCLLLFAFSGPVGKPPARENASDAFSLSSLSFYINDEGVAALVKKDQQNSFLKEGGPLSLSLISDEKARLKELLEKNGYENISNHAISFVMDTSAASHSFSVQVTINLDKTQKNMHQADKVRGDNTAIKRTAGATDIRYAITSVNKKTNAVPIPANSQPVNKKVVTGLPVVKQ